MLSAKMYLQSWLFLLGAVFCCFVSFTSAQISIDNQVELADGDISNIRPGTPLLLRCSADVVGLEDSFMTINSVEISRQLHGSQDVDLIIKYEPYNLALLQPLAINNPSNRDWEFEEDAPTPFPTASRNTRSMMIEWTINDANCRDAGVYQCQVDYVSSSSTVEERKGQQNLTSRAPTRNLFMTIVPQMQNYEYTENDNVTMSCSVEGPRNLQIIWRYGLAATGILQDYIPPSEDLTMTSLNDDCDAVHYRSAFEIQLREEDNGYMFACFVRYNQDMEGSTNITLNVNPVGGSGNFSPATGGNNDAGMIAGIIIGVLAFIVIDLLLVYFCWYRKRKDSSKDEDAETDTKPDMHAPPPVFYSKPNKPPKDDRDDGTWGNDNRGRKPRYDTYDSDRGDDYNSGRKTSSSSTGGRRGRNGSASSVVKDRDGYPSRSAYDEEDMGYGPESKTHSYDSYSRPRYEKRRSKDREEASPHAPVNTTDVSTRSEDEASDAPLNNSYGQKPRPKRRTSRPSSGSEDREDRRWTNRRGDRDREDNRERQGDPALHYAQLDLVPSSERETGRRGRRGDKVSEQPVEYAEIRV